MPYALAFLYDPAAPESAYQAAFLISLDQQVSRTGVTDRQLRGALQQVERHLPVMVDDGVLSVERARQRHFLTQLAKKRTLSACQNQELKR